MPVLQPIAAMNKRAVDRRLRQYGLRWDDILDDSPEMTDAIKVRIYTAALNPIVRHSG